MRESSSFAALIFIVIFGIGGGLAFAMYRATANMESAWIGVIAFVIALVVSLAIKVADQWERVVILRLRKFRSLKGPGLSFIVPVIDVISYWIDTRVITGSFKAEKTLTKDTVPVDVEAVLFWKVLDPKKAALDVADYRSAISWASQTALRDIIGKTMLADMLEGREKIGGELQKIIDLRTEPWGINVISVEIKDVLIPPALEDAMSMQAQAERERQARVILGDSERQVAEKFGETAKTYTNNPIALHLRAMNMLYEGLLARLGDPAATTGRVILAHLGNGASLAAVRDGKSIDTSMGFTPTAGLVMSTRAGDLDPGLAPYLARSEQLTTKQFYKMVNHESVLLGVSETSSDMRDLLAHEASDLRAAEAVALFCYQAKKWIGSFTAALGGLDTLVFAGGIGENAPVVRARICGGLEILGIELNEVRNAETAGVISADTSRVAVRVIRTDEERMIAKTVCRVLGLG